ncbi:MAG: hypothetical protein HY958_05155 [Bacteroidia bacterium]|nr:hypothetical protein [Bacteroidia bacterium]
MKKYILLLILSLPTAMIFAQDNYTVIKANGKIVIVESNKALVTGVSFNDNNKLDFETSDARAAVMSPGKGRFVLMQNKSGIAYAKANLTPSMSNISSRGGILSNKIDMENHFSGKYVILNKIGLKINSNAFPMDEEHFFYIQYEYKGEKINKKLPYKNDTLIIDRAELFTIDGWPIPNPNIPDMDILYMNKKDGGKSIKINSFNPVFPNLEDLKKEIEIILESSKKLSSEEKIQTVLSYINEMYGKPDKDNVAQWLKKNNLLK